MNERTSERMGARDKLNNYYYLFTINELSHIKKLTSFKLIPTARTIFQVIVIIHFFLYVNTDHTWKSALRFSLSVPLVFLLARAYSRTLACYICIRLYDWLTEPWLNFLNEKKKITKRCFALFPLLLLVHFSSSSSFYNSLSNYSNPFVSLLSAMSAVLCCAPRI